MEKIGMEKPQIKINWTKMNAFKLCAYPKILQIYSAFAKNA